jgi:hypothetical protein
VLFELRRSSRVVSVRLVVYLLTVGRKECGVRGWFRQTHTTTDGVVRPLVRRLMHEFDEPEFWRRSSMKIHEFMRVDGPPA